MQSFVLVAGLVAAASAQGWAEWSSSAAAVSSSPVAVSSTSEVVEPTTSSVAWQEWSSTASSAEVVESETTTSTASSTEVVESETATSTSSTAEVVEPTSSTVWQEWTSSSSTIVVVESSTSATPVAPSSTASTLTTEVEAPPSSTTTVTATTTKKITRTNTSYIWTSCSSSTLVPVSAASTSSSVVPASPTSVGSSSVPVSAATSSVPVSAATSPVPSIIVSAGSLSAPSLPVTVGSSPAPVGYVPVNSTLVPDSAVPVTSASSQPAQSSETPVAGVTTGWPSSAASETLALSTPSETTGAPITSFTGAASGNAGSFVAAEDGKGEEDLSEPAVYDDEKKLLKIFVVGVPDWQAPGYSYVTIVTNVLLALLTLDLVFRAPFLHPAKDLRFSRVGFVDQTSAKVLFREPDPAQLPVYVHLREASASSSWTTTDRIYYLDADTDYTYPITFTGLSPDTVYTYSLSNDLSGKFTTAPGHFSPKANRLTFVTSSCIKANFPYQPFAHSLAFHGFDYLSKALRSLPNPAAFMLFLGDFIYVDVPLRLSSSYLHYRAEYRRAYASPSWNLPGLSSLPWLHTLDDHEIANDWSGGNDTAPFPAASDPFIHYQVAVNPPIPPSASNGDEPNTTYFQFSRGPASFFLLDTRRYRTSPEPQPPSLPTTSNHSMLGATQLSSLLTYLRTPEPAGVHFKIISSSVPLTKNWRFGTSDTWGGFLSERSQILHAMHAAERDLGVRVIILSGDRHEFGAIRYPPPLVSLNANGSDVVYDRTPASGPHEFSVGPLSMFYLPIRTFRQIDDEDVVLKYIPDGNTKFGVVELRNLEGKGGDQKAILKYTLWINGNVEWEYVLTSPGPGYRPRARAGPFGLLWS
ncbi:hypothetical protein DV735_g4265, partial [Chaetothyriales sp. CBS 134920]